MARLERARTEVFDAGDAAPLGRADLEDLPPESFAELRLSLVPASAFVDLAWNADEVWDAIEDARTCPAPRPIDATVLVWRRDLQVIHRTLELDEAVLLTRFAMGEPFGSACDSLVGHDEPIQRAIELLLRWLDAAILAAPPSTGDRT